MNLDGRHEPELERWPHYRLRGDVCAKRVGRPFVLDHRMYHDGYIVVGKDGHAAVVPVAQFEALFEPHDRG